MTAATELFVEYEAFFRVFASRGTYRRRMGTGACQGHHTLARRGPTLGRALIGCGALGLPLGALRTPEASRTFIYGGKDFV